MRYAEVAVNAAVQGTFHYHVPPTMDAALRIGHLVRVGFGTAMQPAIVVAIHEQLPQHLATIKTKPILEILDLIPVMTPQHIALGLWMSEHYLASPGACLWLMLPPGLTGKSTRQIVLKDFDAISDDPTAAEILDALRAKPVLFLDDAKKVAGIKSTKKLMNILNKLEERGSIHVHAALAPPSAKAKRVRTVESIVPEDEILSALNMLSNAPKQREVFFYIARHRYPVDVTQVYEACNTNSAILNTLMKRHLILFGSRLDYRDSLADRDFVPSYAPRLTGGQQAVWRVIQSALQGDDIPTTTTQTGNNNLTHDAQKNADVPIPDDTALSTHSTGYEGLELARRKFLLHGVTGSGKTEIYLHAIAEVIAHGRQAIFLVPEIALTPQTIRRVAQRFPDQVAVVHGSLSTGERYDTWKRARQGEINVIVGTRSALFTPLPDVGLIILDEEHDHSYKHAPPFNPPFYHARDVAEQMAQLNDATLILGSATPDMGTYFRAKQGALTYLHMPDRIMGHRQRIEKQARDRNVAPRYQALADDTMTIDLPPVSVIDMRDELKAGNRSMFSRDLQAALAGVIERGEQAILFLNRRGQATYVFCRDCGYVVACERCDTPMTYHRYGEAMRCHHCGNQQQAPTTCPQCRSNRIKYFGAGTQQVEAELRKLHPDVTAVRWDADTASKPDMHEQILARFVKGEAQIMVGTQMVAKGLDLPLVTLVGVVSADPGLALPDFRASERAFQLLTQVAGRAGRGVLGGEVIVQTYNPQHPGIVAASTHDYEGFYTGEIAWRREAGYPPYRRLGRVLVQHTHPVEAQRQIESIAKQLKRHIQKRSLTDTHLIGPAPCFFSRIDRHYRWQLLIRSADPRAALAGLQIRPGWYVDIDPVDIL